MKRLFLLLAMLVTLCSGVAGNLSALETIPFIGMSKALAFETKPVNFVVIDRTGSVTNKDMRGWQRSMYPWVIWQGKAGCCRAK